MPSRAIDEKQLLEKIRKLPKEKVKEVEEFVDILVRYPTAKDLDAAYQAMAADEAREREALTWSETHVDEGLDEMPPEKPKDWH